VITPFTIDHEYVKPAGPLAVFPVELSQTTEGSAVIVGADGFAFAVTTVGAEVELQPFPSMTVTVYEPELDTTIDCVVAVVDQRYVYPLGAVSVTLPPAHNVVGPLGVIVGVGGFGLTVTTVGAEVELHPLPSLTVTVYEPALVTRIDCVVAPVDHEYV